jgi:hypothetical protein
VLEGVDEKGGDEPAVLSVFDQRLIGGTRQQHVTDAPDFVIGSLARETVNVNLALPVSKTRARPRAHGAALLAVGAVVGSAVEVKVEWLIDALVGLVVQHRVRTGDDARRAPRAQPRSHYFAKQLSPLRFFNGHENHLSKGSRGIDPR